MFWTITQRSINTTCSTCCAVAAGQPNWSLFQPIKCDVLVLVGPNEINTKWNKAARYYVNFIRPLISLGACCATSDIIISCCAYEVIPLKYFRDTVIKCIAIHHYPSKYCTVPEHTMLVRNDYGITLLKNVSINLCCWFILIFDWRQMNSNDHIYIMSLLQGSVCERIHKMISECCWHLLQNKHFNERYFIIYVSICLDAQLPITCLNETTSCGMIPPHINLVDDIHVKSSFFR